MHRKYILGISTIFDAVKINIYIFIAVFFVTLIHTAYAQQNDSAHETIPDTAIKKTDTFLIKKTPPRIKKNNTIARKDTVKNIIFPSDTLAENLDTARPAAVIADTINVRKQVATKSYAITDSLLYASRFINIKEAPVLFIASPRIAAGKEFIFYILCIVVFILGLFKTFYPSYFNNIFRVFFNTSIRQTQLTDQLIQAKLPSFILNIFFSVSAGIYVWLLFKNYHAPKIFNTQWLLPFCIAGISAVYFIKFIILKLIGWMSEMQQAANDYIFVIFLINKIAGIVLIPFVILLAFAVPQWVNYLTTLSLLITGLFFLSRYIKTYSLLQYKFPLRPLHFLIYIAAIEIVPLLLIYKVVADYVI